MFYRHIATYCHFSWESLTILSINMVWTYIDSVHHVVSSELKTEPADFIVLLMIVL